MKPLSRPNQPPVPHDDRPLGLDASLIERIASGDTAAFTALLRGTWRSLVTYCAGIVGTVDTAEDIAQEAFIRFWEHRSEWKPRSSARAILYTIARNLALNQRQSAAGRQRLLAGRGSYVPHDALSPQEWVEGKELEGALGRAISLLPHRQQEILLLSRVDGLSRAEVAEITGLSHQTVANHLVMALKNLRKILGQLLNDP